MQTRAGQLDKLNIAGDANRFCGGGHAGQVRDAWT